MESQFRHSCALFFRIRICKATTHLNCQFEYEFLVESQFSNEAEFLNDSEFLRQFRFLRQFGFLNDFECLTRM